MMGQQWTIQQDGRGPWDIVWTCLLTIFLCCWTSICINVQSLTDGPWNRFRDKLNLAVFCIIGPDFMILLSIGQWESACQSLKVVLLFPMTELLTADASMPEIQIDSARRENMDTEACIFCGYGRLPSRCARDSPVPPQCQSAFSSTRKRLCGLPNRR